MRSVGREGLRIVDAGCGIPQGADPSLIRGLRKSHLKGISLRTEIKSPGDQDSGAGNGNV